jgi:hypothetical protein
MAAPASATNNHHHGHKPKGPEILRLNTWNPRDVGAVSVTSDRKLKRGDWYAVRASGTFSYYEREDYVTPGAPWSIVCGTPESAPVTPSRGRPNGAVGLDVETVIARPWTPAACSQFPLPHHWRNFEMRLNSGFAHRDPIGGPYLTPRPDHVYSYVVPGYGRKATFRLRDEYTPDNYGVVTIELRRATAADCQQAQSGGQPSACAGWAP